MGIRSLFLIVAGLVSGTALMIGMSQQAANNDMQISEYQEEVLLNQIAKSAENLVLAQAKRDFDNAASNVNHSDVAMKGGSFSSSAVANGDNELEVTVLAEYAGLKQEIVTTLQRNPGAGTLDAAFMIDAPSANVSLWGNYFCIIGNDHNPPSIGGSSPGLNVGGVRATSHLVRDQIRTAMTGDRLPNIIGVNGGGDIYNETFSHDLNTIYRDAVMNADQTHNGENISGTFGSAGNPVVLHVTGDADISESMSGYGMLVIDGDLNTAEGTIYWEGVVVVNKETDLKFKLKDSSLIYGSVIVMNGSRAFNMPGNGTLDITYYQSGSAMESSLNIRPVGATSSQIFASGVNGSSDQSTNWSTSYEYGQQINFYTTTTPPEGSSFNRAAMVNSPLFATQPHAKIRPITSESWEIAFETGATALSEEEAAMEGMEAANWDYYDEKIIVTYVPDNTVPPGDNTSSWTSSFAYNTPMSSSSSTAEIIFAGTGTIIYSSEAIARLEGLLPAFNKDDEIVVTERFVKKPLPSRG